MIGNMKKIGIFMVVLCICAGNISAQDIQITQKEAGADLRFESNRSLDYSGDISVFGDIELNSQFGLKSGLALGWVDAGFDIVLFGSVRYAPFAGLPLNANILYNYNGLPGPLFNSHTHSLLPYISYNARMAGIAAGINCRFTSYFGEPAIFESMLSFSGYVNFINTDTLLFGLSVANFNDFDIRNMGSYYASLNLAIRLNDQWTFTNGLEFKQAGSIGLSSTFYGFTYRGGVRFTW